MVVLAEQRIKRCPFCGGTANAIQMDWAKRKLKPFIVACDMCGSSSGSWKTAKGAILQWNRRVNDKV